MASLKSMPDRLDVIVVGCGAMGSATCFACADLGLRALGLEARTCAHDQGSSHGHSRIVREAYFEHPDYVPLAMRSREMWIALGARAGERLFHQAGVVYGGAPGSPVVRGSLHSARQFGVPIERLSAAGVMSRWKQFRVPAGFECLHEPRAGFARPEQCISVNWRLAREAGAQLREGARVDAWREVADGVEVDVDGRTIAANSLVLTAGAWTGRLANQLGLPIRPARQPLGWAEPIDQAAADESRMPGFLFDEGEAGAFYGVPCGADQPPPQGIKVAWHLPGPTCDPDAMGRTATAAEVERLNEGVARYLSPVAGPLHASAICIYQMTPDQNFLVGRAPGHRRVFMAAGFSGHGFKFAPVIGEAMACLAAGRPMNPCLEFLNPARSFHPVA